MTRTKFSAAFAAAVALAAAAAAQDNVPSFEPSYGTLGEPTAVPTGEADMLGIGPHELSLPVRCGPVGNVGLTLAMELGAAVEGQVPAAMYGSFFAFPVGQFEVLAVQMDSLPDGHLCIVATGIALSR